MENAGETLHRGCRGMRLRRVLVGPALATGKGQPRRRSAADASPVLVLVLLKTHTHTHKETSVPTVAAAHLAATSSECALLFNNHL